MIGALYGDGRKLPVVADECKVFESGKQSDQLWFKDLGSFINDKPLKFF